MMMDKIEPKFLTRLLTQKVGGDCWQLVADLKYRSSVVPAIFTVPFGFVTDFASVPRVPIAFYLAGDTAHRASVVHDYLYQTHLTSRARADAVFKEAMKVTGEPRWRRWLMWAAVRVAGRGAYNRGPEKYRRLNC